ncbi:MAG: 50S ribosomal protein L11 methyltransferase [Bacteroidia bacterium]|nr:50S ribosomal protein L11 methyltransferase [Bacteroidia bacterium]
MNYKSVKINIEPFFPYAEIIMAELAEIGFDSFDDNSPPLLIGYCPENNYNLQQVNEVLKNTSAQSEIKLSIVEITNYKSQNWNAEWESSFQPITINQQIIIRAPFHEQPQNFLFDIVIQPKMAFGTGHHETTYQMAENMLPVDFDNKTVLDMGTGTGVLGILARMKKSKKVYFVDIDDWSIENTRENILLNNSDHYEIIKGDINAVPSTTFDIILANINKNILKQQLPFYANLLSKNGLLFMSGFFTTDVNELTLLANQFNFKLIKQTEKNSWACVIYIKE